MLQKRWAARIGSMLFCSVLVAVALRPADTQGQTEAATRQYAVAAGFQNQKLYEQAVEEWQTFIKKFPTDARQGKARHYLGTCSLQLKNFDAAITALDELVKRYPNFSLLDESMVNLGVAYYGRAQKTGEASEFQSAQRTFAALQADFPKSSHIARALFYRGESHYHQQQFAEAAASYSSLIQHYPRSELVGGAYYALGVTQEAMNQTAEAAATFSAFVRGFPKHNLVPEVRMRQGEVLFTRGDYAHAQALFAEVAAVLKYPLADVAMLRQARCLYEQGEYANAADVYREIPRRFKGTKHYATAVLAGAKCFYLNGNYETARSGLEVVAKRDVPEAAEASQWIARSYLKQDQANEALKVLDMAIRRHAGSPHLPQLLLARADTLYEIPERRPETIALYAAFTLKYPADPLSSQAQYMAALTSQGLDQHETAKQHSDTFLARYPKDKLVPDVLFISAESRLLLGQYNTATTQYRRFLQAAPQHANADQARVRLGLALQLQKRYEEAIALLEPLDGKLQDQSVRSEALYLTGRCYAALQNHEKAATALHRSLRVDPKRQHADETLLALADSYIKLGQNKDALAQLQNLVTDLPGSTRLDEAYYRLGEISYADGKFDQALAFYRRVTKDWPESTFTPHAQYGIGWARFDKQDFDGADKAMTAIIRDYPDADVGRRAHYVRGMVYHQLGQFEPAVTDLKAFLASKPKQSDRLDAQYVLGLSQAGLQRFEAAVRTYQAILDADPQYAGADKVVYELAWAHEDLGNQEESTAAFGRLAARYPDSPLAAESQFHVGEGHYKAGEYAAAATAYTSAYQVANNTADLGEKALHKLAWSYLKPQQFDRASEAFQTQLKIYPDGELVADAMFLLGECEFKQQRWEEALPWYAQVIAAESPQYEPLALYRSGQCAGSLQQWSTSLRFHNRVLEEFPEFEQKAESRYSVGWTLQNQDKLDEAIQQYEQVTEETDSETAAKARFMIGECYFTKQDHQTAAKHFLKAAYGYGHEEWSAMAFFEAGRCFEVLKDVNQARNSYQAMIKTYPGHDQAALARRRLAELGES